MPMPGGSAVPLGSGHVPDGGISSASVNAEDMAESRRGDPRVDVGDRRESRLSCTGRDNFYAKGHCLKPDVRP
jgi:hypothetical protein